MAWTEIVNYAKLQYRYWQHFERYRRRVEAMQPKLICQECGGSGGGVEPVLDDGTGPFEACGLCEGTGYLTPHRRGLWLRWKREEKQLADRSTGRTLVSGTGNLRSNRSLPTNSGVV